MIVHTLQELGSNPISRIYPNNRIDAALGAHCGLFLINPLGDLVRSVDGQTVEATAERTSGKFLSIISTMAMGAKMILIESGHRKAEFDHVITLR